MGSLFIDNRPETKVFQKLIANLKIQDLSEPFCEWVNCMNPSNAFKISLSETGRWLSPCFISKSSVSALMVGISADSELLSKEVRVFHIYYLVAPNMLIATVFSKTRFQERDGIEWAFLSKRSPTWLRLPRVVHPGNLGETQKIEQLCWPHAPLWISQLQQSDWTTSPKRPRNNQCHRSTPRKPPLHFRQSNIRFLPTPKPGFPVQFRWWM